MGQGASMASSGQQRGGELPCCSFERFSLSTSADPAVLGLVGGRDGSAPGGHLHVSFATVQTSCRLFLPKLLRRLRL